MYVMVIPTVVMAFLPTYQQVGIFAPILLLLIRVIQGFSVGGQGTGVLIYLAEHTEVGKRGFITSFGIGFSTIGFLLGSFVAYSH